MQTLLYADLHFNWIVHLRVCGKRVYEDVHFFSHICNPPADSNSKNKHKENSAIKPAMTRAVNVFLTILVESLVISIEMNCVYILGIKLTSAAWKLLLQTKTRFGPNRPAADMEGNGEFDFWVIYEYFSRICEDVWRFFEEFWRNWFVVRLRTSINQRQIKKMRF